MRRLSFSAPVMEHLVCLSVCALALPLAAHALPASAEEEISRLFAALEASGCEFSRNGSWHSASEASSHLRRKYDYLPRRNLVQSAESFIDRAASQSSVTGRACQVRCGQAQPVDSKAWFLNQLRLLRQKG